MIVTAAFLPAAPVLVPSVAQGAAGELADLRAACLATVRSVLPGPDGQVLLVASGPATDWPDTPPSFARLGLPDPPADDRPVALQVGRWLLSEAGWGGRAVVRSVDGTRTAEADPGEVVVLVLGDGSARRSPAAPGYLHPDAEAYDERVAGAIGAADAAALLALDPADDARLLVNGRAAWQAVARAEGPPWVGELAWSGAPYGVGYFVGAWRR